MYSYYASYLDGYSVVKYVHYFVCCYNRYIINRDGFISETSSFTIVGAIDIHSKFRENASYLT